MYQKYRIKTNFIGLLVFVSCLSISLRSATDVYIIIPICLGLILALSTIIFKYDHMVALVNICLALLVCLDAAKIIPSYLDLRYSLVYIPLILYFSIDRPRMSLEEVVLLVSIPVLGHFASLGPADIGILLGVSGLVFIIGKYSLNIVDLENMELSM